MRGNALPHGCFGEVEKPKLTPPPAMSFCNELKTGLDGQEAPNSCFLSLQLQKGNFLLVSGLRSHSRKGGRSRPLPAGPSHGGFCMQDTRVGPQAGVIIIHCDGSLSGVLREGILGAVANKGAGELFHTTRLPSPLWTFWAVCGAAGTLGNSA